MGSFVEKYLLAEKISLPLSENSKSERFARILSRPLSRIFFRSAVLLHLLHKEEFGGTLEQSISSDLGSPS